MLEISPVLSGKFDQPGYLPAQGNFNLPTIAAAGNTPAPAAINAAAVVPATTPASAPSAAQNIDPRRYTQFDRTASQVADADFSFSDLLDTVNPLQHIPVVSSAYRAVMGEAINPVARVAGDILYGGALGVASAVAGGIEAVADSAIESQTGKDGIGYVMASLFGSGKSDATVAVASAAPTNAAQSVALTSAPVVPASQIKVAAAENPGGIEHLISSPSPGFMSSLQLPPQPAAQPTATTQANAPATNTAATAAVTAAATGDNTQAAAAIQGDGPKFIPLDRSKIAYSGKMTSANPISQQTLAALQSSGVPMTIGHTVYASPVMNGAHPAFVAPPAATPAPPALPLSSMISANAPAANTSQPPLPQNLGDDAAIMRALSQYRNVAGGSTPAGSRLDVTN